MPDARIDYITEEQFDKFVKALSIYAKWLVKGNPNGYLVMNYVDQETIDLIAKTGVHNYGIYNNITALKQAYPDGTASISPGSYAYVIGADELVVIYFWDFYNKKWITITESGTGLSQAEVVSQLESNAGFNRYTTAYFNYVASISSMNVNTSITTTSPGNYLQGSLSVGDSNTGNRYITNTKQNTFLSLNVNWKHVYATNISLFMNNSVYNGTITIPLPNSYNILMTVPNTTATNESIKYVMYVANATVANTTSIALKDTLVMYP